MGYGTSCQSDLSTEILDRSKEILKPFLKTFNEVITFKYEVFSLTEAVFKLLHFHVDSGNHGSCCLRCVIRLGFGGGDVFFYLLQ